MDPTGATSAARFLPRSVAASEANGPGPLRHVETTGSTNADLADEARGGDTAGAVLVADHQTAGRGRLDRTWDDDHGDALLVSFRVPVRNGGAGWAVRALGAAARAAADDLCVERVAAKWPNDLVVTDGANPGKLAGVLAEFVSGRHPCVVIGIGINIRPIERQPGSTSIVDCGGPDDRDRLLAALIEQFAARRRDDAGVLDELRTHSATLGAPVRVETPGGGEVTGTATDLTSEGELVVRAEDGRDHVIAVGDVVHVRPG